MYFKINKFSKMIGVNPKTLRRWSDVEDGLLKPAKILNSGHRLYTYEQYLDYVGKDGIKYNSIGELIN